MGHRVWLGITLALSLALLVPATAGAYAFHKEDARDWVQANFYKSLYSLDYYDRTCTCLVSLAYRKGAGVPFRDYGDNDTEAWWVDPDAWGGTVVLMYRSPSWVNVGEFRDHFNSYPPAGNDWIRITLHRCSVAPTSDTRWAGGYVTFYHHSVDLEPTGACTYDYFHVGMIYARNVQSWYDSDPDCYGTCKVDRSPEIAYRGPNLINLKDRILLAERKTCFVQVNTLVYDP